MGKRHYTLAVCAIVMMLTTGCADTPAPPSSSSAEAAVPASPTSHEKEAPDSVITYRYVYPYNTEDLVENHYVELSMRADSVTGRYYGTTDDFDSAREGYRPGFFVTTMNDLRIADGVISFSLSPWDYFITPRTPGRAGATDQTRWKGPKLASSRSYRGTLTPDSLVLYMAGGARPFVRVPH